MKGLPRPWLGLDGPSSSEISPWCIMCIGSQSGSVASRVGQSRHSFVALSVWHLSVSMTSGVCFISERCITCGAASHGSQGAFLIPDVVKSRCNTSASSQTSSTLLLHWWAVILASSTTIASILQVMRVFPDCNVWCHLSFTCCLRKLRNYRRCKATQT